MKFPLFGVYFAPFTMLHRGEYFRGLACFRSCGSVSVTFEQDDVFSAKELEAFRELLRLSRPRIVAEIQSDPRVESDWVFNMGTVGFSVEVEFDNQHGPTGGYVEITHTETGDSGVIEMVHDANGTVRCKSHPGTIHLSHPEFIDKAIDRLIFGHTGQLPFRMTFPQEVPFGQPAVRVEDEPDANPYREVTDNNAALVADYMRFFAWTHLPDGPMQLISRRFAVLADIVNKDCPNCPQKLQTLGSLLEAKDAAVRTFVPKGKA